MGEYDVIVLGGGSAGTAAAAAATRAGARTLMINEGELGGLCILRGCMPTKTLLASAHAIHRVEHLEPLGARLVGRVVVDFDRVMQRKDATVSRFQRAKIESVEAQGYDVLFGRGLFVGEEGIEVGGTTLRAGSYVIATGSAPARLPIPGVDDVPVWTSDEVMRLDVQPSRLLVLGAGPVGLELAQFFARIGSEVVLVNRSPLLSHHDLECGRELEAALAVEPRLELCVPARVDRLEPIPGGLRATVDCGGRSRQFEADALLMAVGRRAALDGLGLDRVGVVIEQGRLAVDESMRTSHPRIYAAGDVTGRYQILHLSKQEGAVAGHNAAAGRSERHMDYRLKMDVIFTDPPFAHVGATEQEARRSGREVIAGLVRLPETGRAITMGVRHGLWRLVADRASGEILGSAILGPRADDLIHTVALLMHHRDGFREIPDLPWYHPTLSEVMLDLARDLESRSR